MAGSSKLPHTLRIVTFFLRLALGSSFFYLGFTTLFDFALERTLRVQSLTELYAWLGSAGSAGTFHLFFEWAFLIAGILLIIGLFTRLAAIGGIALVLASYLPNVLSGFTIYQFINNEVIVVLCLLVIIFSNAGAYIGLDTFIHFGAAPKHKD